MSEPTLAQVFGSGATQDAATLSIAKTDLVAVGLSATAANNAEGLLAAVLKLAANSLTVANQQTNAEQSVTIQPTNASVYESPFGTRIRQSLLVSFDDDFTNPGITPDNY